MYFAVMKLKFESGPNTSHDNKAEKALTTKLCSKFKISAMSNSGQQAGEYRSIVVTALGASQTSLTNKLDSICEFCESNFGRIEAETTLFDHVESIEDETDLYEEKS